MPSLRLICNLEMSSVSTPHIAGPWQMAAIPVPASSTQRLSEGCAFVVLPSLFRFRGGQSQENGFSVDEAALLPFTCGN